MAVECEFYLSCSSCSAMYKSDGFVVKTDSEDDVRGQAEDDGWLVDHGYSEDDYCPECRAKIEDE